jgi:hypothetical protein
MSGSGPDQQPRPQEFLAQAYSSIFDTIAERLRQGSFYPAKGNKQAEYVEVVPELGRAAVFSTDADQIDSPELIHGERHRPESEVHRFVEYWLTRTDIDVQHGSWDENHDPHPIDDRQPIHPEELVELYNLLIP